MFKTLTAVATLAAVVVAQDQPLWSQPNIPPECNPNCVGMLKFQPKCGKADLTCLVELCTDPDTVVKCLNCAKADTTEFTNACKQIEEAKKEGKTEIPTGSAADAVVASAKAAESTAANASATPTASSGNAASSGGNAASSGGNAASSGASAAGHAASSVSSAATAATSKAASGAEKLAPAALVGAAGLLAALY